MGIWIWLWLMVGAWAEDPGADVICPEDTREAVLDAALAVEQAWLHLDGPAFDVARNRMGRFLMCVDVPLTAEDALTMHRARGLIAFVDGDHDAARRAFAAVHALQPDWKPPEHLVPREHPLWRVFESAVDDDESAKMVPFRALPSHGWSVDGTRYPRAQDPVDEHGAPTGSYGLPGDRAFVLQVFDKRAFVTYTGYHFSTADVPIQDIVEHTRMTAERLRRRRNARIVGSVLGAGLLAAGATTFALGWDERAGFEQGTLTLEEAPATAKRANDLGISGYSLAGAGALAFTLAWSIPW